MNVYYEGDLLDWCVSHRLEAGPFNHGYRPTREPENWQLLRTQGWMSQQLVARCCLRPNWGFPWEPLAFSLCWKAEEAGFQCWWGMVAALTETLTGRCTHRQGIQASRRKQSCYLLRHIYIWASTPMKMLLTLGGFPCPLILSGSSLPEGTCLVHSRSNHTSLNQQNQSP